MDYYHQLKKQQLSFSVVIPFPNYEKELEHELLFYGVKLHYKSEKIFLVEKTNSYFIWAQDIWKDCHVKQFSTELISELKSLPHWGYYYHSENSAEQKNLERALATLKKVPEKRIKFNPAKTFNFKFYIYTIHKDLVIYCENPLQSYPAGWHEFEEDKIFPPNRAYLKLWEAFTTQKLKVDKTQNALEIGAAPGGWSWVLSQFFNKVYTFDRADLAPQIKKISNIEHRIGDAFKIDPNQFNDVDWFFSDLICTPEKIYETIQFWLTHSRVKNYVCTIKFKGQTDFEIIDKLLKIPDSKIVRLYQNKNEVTWIKQER